jgi:hypothetical protein
MTLQQPIEPTQACSSPNSTLVRDLHVTYNPVNQPITPGYCLSESTMSESSMSENSMDDRYEQADQVSYIKNCAFLKVFKQTRQIRTNKL